MFSLVFERSLPEFWNIEKKINWKIYFCSFCSGLDSPAVSFSKSFTPQNKPYGSRLKLWTQISLWPEIGADTVQKLIRGGQFKN